MNIKYYHVSTKDLSIVEPRACQYEDVQTTAPAVFLSTSPYPHHTVTDIASPYYGGKIYEVIPRGEVFYGAAYQEAYTLEPCDVVGVVSIEHRKDMEIMSDDLLQHIIDCEYDSRIEELVEYYLDTPGVKLEINLRAESYVNPDLTNVVKWVCTQIYRL